MSSQSRIKLNHVKAHAENRKTLATFSTHELGNYIVDAIAGYEEGNLPNRIKANLHITQDISIETLLRETYASNPIRLSASGTTFQGSAQSIHKLIARKEIDQYLKHRAENYYGHHRKWENYRWDLSGKAIAKLISSNANHIWVRHRISESKIRTLHLKTIYDKFPNDYYKHKIQDKDKTIDKRNYSSTIENNEDDQDENDDALNELEQRELPFCPCPGCTLLKRDSITHTLGECDSPEITQERNKVVTELMHVGLNIENPDEKKIFQKLTSLLHANPQNSTLDSRRWGGLFENSIIENLKVQFSEMIILKAIKRILLYTIPYISNVWTLYTKLTHKESLPQHPKQHIQPHTQPEEARKHNRISIDRQNGKISMELIEGMPQLPKRQPKNPKPNPKAPITTQRIDSFFLPANQPDRKKVKLSSIPPEDEQWQVPKRPIKAQAPRRTVASVWEQLTQNSMLNCKRKKKNYLEKNSPLN